MWALADVLLNQQFKEWGYASFHQWINEEKDIPISSAYAYQLARIGVNFKDQKEKVTQLLSDGQANISRLSAAVAQVVTGKQNPNEAIESIVEKKKDDGERDPEENIKLVLYVPRGDAERVLAFVSKVCIKEKKKNLNEWFRDEYSSSEIGVPDRLRIFLPIIESGNYFCAVCGDVPTDPQLHHVLKQSVGHGYGAQALVCGSCHLDTIHGQNKDGSNDRWKMWARRWGVDWRADMQEAEKQLKETGKVDQAPYKIITGSFKNLKQ